MPISKHCSVEMRMLSFGTNTSGPKKKYTLVSSLFRVMFLDVFRAVGMMDKSVCEMLKRYSDQVLINYCLYALFPYNIKGALLIKANEYTLTITHK